MKFHILLEQGEDGYIVAQCPSLPSCVSQGKTREEALENIKDALQGILKLRRKLGLPIPEETIVEVEAPA